MANRMLRAALLAACLGAGAGAAGAQPETARQPVDVLIEALAAPHAPFSCGQANADAERTRKLIAFGEPAAAEIERALTVRPQLRTHWRLVAYARLRGAAALPKLLEWREGGERGEDAANDEAMAVAPSLTSYVSGARPLARRFRCARGPTPVDAPDQLILAWMKGDRAWLEDSLGPSARRALRDAATPARPPAERLALGYWLEGAGAWSESDGAWELRDRQQPVYESQTLTLVVGFRTRTGARCGERTVRFAPAEPAPPGHLAYGIDDAEVGALLRLVATCSGARQR